MNNYRGHFNWFSEMGMEGATPIFEDLRARYLGGYESLELSYFFKNLNTVKVNVCLNNEIVYDGVLTFIYSTKHNGLIPLEVNLKTFNLWISQKAYVSLDSEKPLYEDKIILKANIKEKDFLTSEISKLLKAKDTTLPDNFKKYKKEFKAIKKYLKVLDSTAVFNDYILSPHSFLFGSTPVEIVLRGDGESLVNWMKERSGL